MQGERGVARWRSVNARRRRVLRVLQRRPWRYGLFVATVSSGALWLWRRAVGDTWNWREAALWALLFFAAGTITAVRLRNDALNPPGRESSQRGDPRRTDDRRRRREPTA